MKIEKSFGPHFCLEIGEPLFWMKIEKILSDPILFQNWERSGEV
jgi:hypothetical protein